MKNESSHWYTPEGEARHFVPRADGKGQRQTTLSDAKKLGLLPSVTGVIDRVMRKPALEKYLITQAVLAVSTAPDVPGESLDQKLVRILEEEQQADEEAARARELGTQIHDALESAVTGQCYFDELAPWVKPVADEVLKTWRPVATERVVVGPGYAGRVDLIVSATDTSVGIIDYKTTKKLPTNGSWPEHRLQLAAYAGALDMHQHVDFVGNIYVSTTSPGEFAMFTWNDWHGDAEVFHHLFEVWKWMTGYHPVVVGGI